MRKLLFYIGCVLSLFFFPLYMFYMYNTSNLDLKESVTKMSHGELITILNSVLGLILMSLNMPKEEK